MCICISPVHTHIYIYTYICTGDIHIYTHMYIYMCVCVCVCVQGIYYTYFVAKVPFDFQRLGLLHLLVGEALSLQLNCLHLKIESVNPG